MHVHIDAFRLREQATIAGAEVMRDALVSIRHYWQVHCEIEALQWLASESGLGYSCGCRTLSLRVACHSSGSVLHWSGGAIICTR